MAIAFMDGVRYELDRPIASYARVSRDARGTGKSAADQLEANRRSLVAVGLPEPLPEDEYVDNDISASRINGQLKDRPDYNRLVAAIRDGRYGMLAAWESSRLQRDLEVYVELRRLCRDNNVLWFHNGRIYDMRRRDDLFRTGLDALIAEDETARIRERIQRGVHSQFEQGQPRARIPYGYRREYDPKTGALLAQVPDEGGTAEVVREIARRLLEGDSAHSIVVDFNRRGVPTPRGGERWSLQTLRRTVIKPANIGQMLHLGRVIGDADWEPILDEASYYACKRILEDPARLTHRGTAPRHLLSGIARCRCGAPQRVTRGGSKTARVLVYACERGCSSLAKDRFEDFVQEAVLQHVEQPEWAAALRVPSQDDRVPHLLDEIEAVQQQLVTARGLAAEMRLSVESLAAMEQSLEPRLELLRGQVAEVSLPPQLLEIAGAEARAVWARWGAEGDRGFDRRRSLIKEVVAVTLNPAGRGVRTIVPGRIEFDWLR